MKKIRIAIIPIFSLILAMALMLLTGCSCFLGSCESQKERIFEEGNFILLRLLSSDSEVAILGLTDKGLEQEVIVVPENIGENEVVRLGDNIMYRDRVKENYGMEHVMFNSNKLSKVFVPFKIKLLSNSGYNGSVMGQDAKCSVIIMSLLESSDLSLIKNDDVKVSSAYYFKIKPWLKDKAINNYNPGVVNPANVTFLYNYDVGNNEVYWVDDYDGELISYVPKNPTRVGYAFAGWYKERECINEWDFSNDVVPKKVFNEEADGSTTYNFYELKLYAKWERK